MGRGLSLAFWARAGRTRAASGESHDIVWAILVSFATAFISVLALVLSVLEVAKAERLAQGTASAD